VFQRTAPRGSPEGFLTPLLPRKPKTPALWAPRIVEKVENLGFTHAGLWKSKKTVKVKQNLKEILNSFCSREKFHYSKNPLFTRPFIRILLFFKQMYRFLRPLRKTSCHFLSNLSASSGKTIFQLIEQPVLTFPCLFFARFSSSFSHFSYFPHLVNK